MTTERRQAAVWGSFVGDALALGAHWVYNPSKIARLIPEVHGYEEPATDYHKGKRAGDFTHYGDQTLVFLQTLARRQGFDSDAFIADWRQFWKNAPESVYRDKATRTTLKTLDLGHIGADAASTSDELAGAARGAPLLLLSELPEARLVAGARTQAAITHGDPCVPDAAEFFTRCALDVIEGGDVDEALTRAAARTYAALPAQEWLEKARSLLDREPVEALGLLGLTCHMPDAFPAVCWLLLRHRGDLRTALAANIRAGGDSAARGMMIGMVLGAAGVPVPEEWVRDLGARSFIEEAMALLCEDSPSLADTGMNRISAAPAVPTVLASQAGGGTFSQRRNSGWRTERFAFVGADGVELSAALDLPAGEPAAYAVFAHCFTCSKDFVASRRISQGLASRGIAVVRFDFTGIGGSGGDFSNSGFTSNVRDLKAAATHLAAEGNPPVLLIGHSLGGAAVLAAGPEIPSVRGIATIAAPDDPGHVEHLFSGAVPEIESTGCADVRLAGRSFRIRREFLEDIREQSILPGLRTYSGALLVLHSPRDSTVNIANGLHIFEAGPPARSFVSLDPADHLLSRAQDAAYAAASIALWAQRICGATSEDKKPLNA